MRKILVLFSVLLLTSCDWVDKVNEASIQNQKEWEEQHLGKFNGQIEETIYEGHEYIIFKEYERGGYGISAIHDPDCPCMKKGE